MATKMAQLAKEQKGLEKSTLVAKKKKEEKSKTGSRKQSSKGQATPGWGGEEENYGHQNTWF